MLDFAYHRRLKKDLARWVDRGLVPAASQDAILADVGRASDRDRFTAILGLLGGLLLAIGVMLFVSANWDAMSKLSRLAILFVGLWGSLGIAVWLRSTSHTYLLEGMLFLAAGVFGASIMLVAQIYHMDGHYPDAVVLWALGAVLIALLLYSPSALFMGFVLLVIWSGSEVLDFDHGFHWPFLPIWLVGTVMAVRRNWRSGLHGGFLALVAWMVINADALGKFLGLSHLQTISLSAVLLLALFAGALAFEKRQASWFHSFEVPLMRYAIIGVFWLAFLWQLDTFQHRNAAAGNLQIVIAIFAVLVVGGLAFLSKKRRALTGIDGVVLTGFALLYGSLLFFGNIWFHSGVLLGFCIWLIGLGQKRRDNVMVVLALVGFGIEVLYLYFETFGNLLDTSLFFLIGGVLLIGLAFGFEVTRRRLMARNKAKGAAS